MSWRKFQGLLRAGGLAVWHRARQFKFRYTIRSLLLTTTAAAVFCAVLLTVNPIAARIAALFLVAAAGLYAAARNDGHGFGSLRGPAFNGALGGALTGLLISAVASALNWLWYCGLCTGEHVLYMIYWWTSAGAVLGGIIGCLVAAVRPKPEASSRCQAAALPPIRLPAKDSFTASRTPRSPAGWRDRVSGVYVSLFVHVSLALLSGTAFYGWGRTTVESTERVELIVALSQEAGSLSDDRFTTIDDMREELFVEQQLQLKKPPLTLAELDAEPLPSDVVYPGDLEDDAMTRRTVPFAPTLSELDPDEHRVTTGTSAQDRSGSKPSRYSVRARGNRAAALKRGGGTALSEDAVAGALQWLARHQNRDGSWSWAYTPNDRCSGYANPGEKSSKMGATGLALLAFLGAGYVHNPNADFENTYELNVRRAVDYLRDNMIVENRAARLFEANGRSHEHMYCHGIAACAIVEAYGATLDADLRKPAQLSLNYIVQAQHPENGGWLYTPRAGGDTSVVGWQVMALKSGALSGLDLPHPAVRLFASP